MKLPNLETHGPARPTKQIFLKANSFEQIQSNPTHAQHTQTPGTSLRLQAPPPPRRATHTHPQTSLRPQAPPGGGHAILPSSTLELGRD